MSLFQLPFRQKPSSLVPAGDFARFFEQCHLSVFRYVMVICAGNQAEAEDITAEAFFRAWEKRGQFSGGPSAALGWVIAIARNLLIDQRRSEAAHPVEIALDEGFSGQESDIEAMLIDCEQIQQVLVVLQTLPFAQRNMFTLRYVLGWRIKDIAAHLSLAENTVSVDLRRAQAKIQSQLVLQELAARSALRGRDIP